jgi:hypothetical protein
MCEMYILTFSKHSLKQQYCVILCITFQIWQFPVSPNVIFLTLHPLFVLILICCRYKSSVDNADFQQRYGTTCRNHNCIADRDCSRDIKTTEA